MGSFYSVKASSENKKIIKAKRETGRGDFCFVKRSGCIGLLKINSGDTFLFALTSLVAKGSIGHDSKAFEFKR